MNENFKSEKGRNEDINEKYDWYKQTEQWQKSNDRRTFWNDWQRPEWEVNRFSES